MTMKSKLKSLLMIALFTVSLASCSKDDNEEEAKPGSSTTTGFTWKENGSSVVQTAASATFSTQYKTIMAKTATGNAFEINLSGTTPATYTLNSSNVITYTKVNPFFIPTSGSVIITANANGKVSGTFQGTGTATAGITSVSGTFTDIPVIP